MTFASWLNYFLSCKSCKYDQFWCCPCVAGRILIVSELLISSGVLCASKTVFVPSLLVWVSLSKSEDSALINLYVPPGRVTPGQLMSYIQLFKNNLKALTNHCGLLQLGMATVETLKHPQTAKWDNFLAFERLLLQVCSCVNLLICYWLKFWLPGKHFDICYDLSNHIVDHVQFWFEWECSTEGQMLEYLVPGCWCCLDRFRRCGLDRWSAPPWTDFEDWKPRAIPSLLSPLHACGLSC